MFFNSEKLANIEKRLNDHATDLSTMQKDIEELLSRTSEILNEMRILNDLIKEKVSHILLSEPQTKKRGRKKAHGG